MGRVYGAQAYNNDWMQLLDVPYKMAQLDNANQQMAFEKWKAQQENDINTKKLGIQQNEANISNAVMAAWAKQNGVDLASLGMGSQQPATPPQIPNPIPQGAMQSLINGQYGNIQGNPIGAIMPQIQPQSINPNSDIFSGMQPSFVGGKFSLKTPTYGASPQDALNAGQMLVSGTLTPSQIPGRNGKLQAIAAAKAIDPTFDAARADINFAVNKMGAGQFEKNYNNLDSYHKDFEKNSDYLLKLSSDFDRSKVPIINRAIIAGKMQIEGDPKATQVLQAINTVANGYARLQNPTLSGQALSDAARQEASSLINGFMSDVQIRSLLDPKSGSMRVDAQNRIDAANEVRSRINGGKITDDSKKSSSGDPLGLF